MSVAKRITLNSDLVEHFNKLPRKPKLPTGMGANDWHFDIRYVPLEPSPGHILALINPGSQFFHIERLPIGSDDSDDGGIAFFPESSAEAAPEVSKALLHAFVNNLGIDEMMGRSAPPAQGPWNFTTEDRELAVAVGEELRCLGVRAPELYKVGVSKPSVIKSMDEQFSKLYKGLARAAGYTGVAEAILDVPQPIVYSGFKVDSPRERGTPTDYELRIKYVNKFTSARPPTSVGEVDSKAITAKVLDEVAILKEKLEKKPEVAIRREADDGDPEAALDYGMRLYVGVGCMQNRTLAREYFVKAILSPRASDTLKATAHGVLINWCVQDVARSLPSRYMLMASHHADQAALLCRRVSPRGSHSSPAVLMFMRNVFMRFAQQMPQLMIFYKNALRAHEDREKQIQAGTEKMQKKRLQQPLRYRCAAVGCGVEADTGRMLSQCAGKCDQDKKPSYCSKECQKADWKNHKPFCIPGAECSVIDDGTIVDTVPPFKTGSIQVPITHNDGSRTLFGSSTMDPQMLKEITKEIKKLAEARGLPPSALDTMRSLNIDLERVD